MADFVNWFNRLTTTTRDRVQQRPWQSRYRSNAPTLQRFNAATS